MITCKNDRLLELLWFVGYCIEFPTQLAVRIGGGAEWNRRVMYRAIREGYVRLYRKKHKRHVIRSMSLTQKGFEYVAQRDPEAVSMIYSRVNSSERIYPGWIDKILRLHAIAIGTVMSNAAGAMLLISQKPSLMSPAKRATNAVVPDPNKIYYYAAHELRVAIEEYSPESVSKSSRTIGIIVKGRCCFFLYFTGSTRMYWMKNSEENYAAAVKSLLLARGFGITSIHQIVIGSSQISEVVRALFHFPEGLIAIGVVVLGIAVLCVFGLRIGWGQNGVTDSDRNLTVSNSGSYGTASFMSPKEASACFEVTSAKRTSQDILGMLPDGQVLTLPKDTRLNANLAVCGSSGTGKSRAISRNLVLQAVKRGESVILTDPKSELYESMGEYLRENGYIVKVFNLVEMDHSDSWNCLGEVGSSELMAQTFADIVLQNTSGDSKDAFWYNAELNLLKALVLYVALEMPPEKRNIATVYDLLYTQTEKGLSDMMASISHEHANQYTGELLPPSPASAPYAIFRQSSETVRTSVIIGLGSKLAVLQAQQVRNITSYNEIDLELPGKQKCAYFCIVSDQDSTYDFLSSLFFSFLFIRLIRYADAYCEGGMLHPKVKFILDEFPNCCLIPDFTKKCSTIRSRGCSVAVFFQNVGQMRNRYPDDQWQEILGACDSTAFLGCTDMLTAEYFSDRIGTASVEVEGTMRELNTMHITDYTPRFRKTNSLGRRPLLTPDEVLRLPPDQVLIFIRGQKVMRAKRFDYSLHPDYKKLKSRKAILHEPDWKSSQASSVSASGVSSPSVTAAIPAEKANVGSQKKPPGKLPRSTTRKVVNADELF